MAAAEQQEWRLPEGFSVDGVTIDPDNKEFNMAMRLVCDTNYPIVYLTGKAGAGKTTFLKALRQYTKKEMVVLAPTGIAAVNAGGQTVHSFFQIDPDHLYLPDDDPRLRKEAPDCDEDKTTIYNSFQYNTRKLKIIDKMELMVIDEVSMLRCELLDVIDRLLRVYRKKQDQPFGGVQVLLIGDAYQLPPVARDDEWSVLGWHYDSRFFFHSKVMRNNKYAYIELKKIYRQREQNFIDLLNRVRTSTVTQNDLALLHDRCKPGFEQDGYITIVTINKTADDINRDKLSKLASEPKTFEAKVNGDFEETAYPTDKDLELKVGARVIFRKNNWNEGYYNGMLGVVESIDGEHIDVKVNEGERSRTFKVVRETWQNIKYEYDTNEKKLTEKVMGSFTQFPLKLAWAITVHKSQGLTFEHVYADLESASEAGQVYVALSRCTTLDGLVLRSEIPHDAICADDNVLSFSKKETSIQEIEEILKNVEAGSGATGQTATSTPGQGLNICGHVDPKSLLPPSLQQALSDDNENIFVIDTNALVDRPEIISKIHQLISGVREYKLVLPAKVIDEVDGLKRKYEDDDTMQNKVRSAQKCIVEAQRNNEISMEESDLSLLPRDFDTRNPDCAILSVACKFKSKNPILITSDKGLTSRALGLKFRAIPPSDLLGSSHKKKSSGEMPKARR